MKLIKIIFIVLILILLNVPKLNSARHEGIVPVCDINSKTFRGYIKEQDIKNLAFQTDGKISFLPYSKGDYIRKGQVIARLDGINYKIKKEKFNLDNEINYNIILAPFDGYIEEIYKKQGDYINANDNILTFRTCNKTEADILVSADYINKINLKKNALVEYKNEKYEAKIANILKSGDNYIVKVQFNPNNKFKKGANVEAVFSMEP